MADDFLNRLNAVLDTMHELNQTDACNALLNSMDAHNIGMYRYGGQTFLGSFRGRRLTLSTNTLPLHPYPAPLARQRQRRLVHAQWRQQQQNQPQENEQEQTQNQSHIVITVPQNLADLLNARVIDIRNGINIDGPTKFMADIITSHNTINAIARLSAMGKITRLLGRFINNTYCYYANLLYTSLEAVMPSGTTAIYMTNNGFGKYLNDDLRKGRIVTKLIDSFGLASWLATETFKITPLLSTHGDDIIDAAIATPGLVDVFRSVNTSTINVLAFKDQIVENAIQQYQQQQQQPQQMPQQQQPQSHLSIASLLNMNTDMDEDVDVDDVDAAMVKAEPVDGPSTMLSGSPSFRGFASTCPLDHLATSLY